MHSSRHHGATLYAKQQLRQLTGKEKRAISEFFRPLIESESMVTLAQIHPKLKEHSLSKKLLLITGMDRKVADWVRTCPIRAVSSETATQQAKTPTEDDSPATKKKKRAPKYPFEFVDEEPLPKESSTSQLVTTLHETNELKRIFKENGKRRCLDKMKNLFESPNK